MANTGTNTGDETDELGGVAGAKEADLLGNKENDPPPITPKTAYRFEVTIPQIWAVAGAAVAVILGAFGIGQWIASSIAQSAAIGLQRQMAELERKLGTAETEKMQAVNKLSDQVQQSAESVKSLADGVSQAQANYHAEKAKAEILLRVANYLMSEDAISEKLLVDTICAMWKQSQRYRLNLSSPQLSPQAIASGNFPIDVQKFLNSRGIGPDVTRVLREPLPPAVFPEINRRNEVQRRKDQTVDWINRELAHYKKIVRFGDGSEIQLPDAIANVVHLSPDCRP